MDFYVGTLEEYNAWHNVVCLIEGIPNATTEYYSIAIENLSTPGTYIWKFGEYDTLYNDKITYQEALAQDFINKTVDF